MRRLSLTVVAAVFAVAAYGQGTVVCSAPQFENFIQVNGSSEREVVPDEIYVSIVISEANLKQRQTVEQLEQEMIDRLKSLGIDTDEDLKIGNMSSRYRSVFLSRNRPQTTTTYQLKVGGAAMLGKVYQVLESLGISNINIIRLDYSKSKEVQMELRAEAMKNARQIAQTLAEAVGQKAGRAVYIMDFAVFPVVYDSMMTRAAGKMANEGLYETELGFRNIKMTQNVTVKFALE